jgi:hypothetical protein
MRTGKFVRSLTIASFLLETLYSGPTLGASGVRNERDYFGVIADRWGRREAAKPPKVGQGDALETWSTATMDAVAVDHTPVAPGENRIFGEQIGPTRTARAMAIVHIAMFEAMNAIDRKYTSYSGIPPIARGAQVDARAAVAQAAYDTLALLYPSQEPRLKDNLKEYLGNSIRHPKTLRGIDLGHNCALSIFTLRINDGSAHREPVVGIDYQTGTGPGQWQQDPIGQSPIALGALWSGVKPFVLSSAAQFRVPPPPLLSSTEYAISFNELIRVGGDGAPGGTSTARTAEQEFIGKYWGYDGTPGLGTPPRLYNQIALTIAKQMGTQGVEMARLLALVNVALADTGIATWESKYTYDFWRPITAIRDGQSDGNPATIGDANWSPLGAPASNTNGPNFTPPFPAYPSGHAAFGAAAFGILRQYYGRDDIAFTFVSDEFNGRTRDIDGSVRPLMPRSFRTLSEAEEENGQSRIYLGIHWNFDKTAGITQGRQVADQVFATTFAPQP